MNKSCPFRVDGKCTEDCQLFINLGNEQKQACTLTILAINITNLKNLHEIKNSIHEIRNSIISIDRKLVHNYYKKL